MRLPRIFVDQPLAPGRLTLPAQPTQHLVQVLRLGAGDALILFNGDGCDRPARILAPARAGAQVEVGRPGAPEPEPALGLHLGMGISKGERMDFALQKAVELGVTRVTPLLTRRTVVKLPADRAARRAEHWRRVMISACEQSGRRRLPLLGPISVLTGWLEADHPYGLMLDHRSPTPLPALPAPGDSVTLLVGPEGGLAEEERTEAARAGFRGVRLGPRILRTETAPLAALATIQALWGDFRA